MRKYLFPAILLITMTTISQPRPPAASPPPIEPGVSLELAKWRAAHYSDVRYKLNLTLEKMSPVLKGAIEIRLKAHGDPVDPTKGRGMQYFHVAPIILDWRKIKGHEEKSTISNVSVNGKKVEKGLRSEEAFKEFHGGETRFAEYYEHNEHLFFSYGVESGENVIKLDFTSPILSSGSAITRYVDKEDGAEYIYSLFVPSDASTAFPVFDQPDLKARFTVSVLTSKDWSVVSNTFPDPSERVKAFEEPFRQESTNKVRPDVSWTIFAESKPISTYVFAFAAGPFERVSVPAAIATGAPSAATTKSPVATAPGTDKTEPPTSIYVRRSQAAKFEPHAAEVFRLNREAIKYFEEYFDYKFPFPKYDLVLIPEFPFGGMEHAGATFLRESSIIFPQEPTRNDHISRALLIFHEASHQWFGDTVTMRWFDDLWLKEGFATFTAYKAMEKIMPSENAWKVFYERVKQAAYQTDSTKGTTPIYQEIPNLSAAKSAYGNIVYNKAPAFLRQTEFYLGEDKFQTAVRAFLKKHEFGNAGWEDLVKEFEGASGQRLNSWAKVWINQKGVPLYRTIVDASPKTAYARIDQSPMTNQDYWWQKVEVLGRVERQNLGEQAYRRVLLRDPPVGSDFNVLPTFRSAPNFVFPNHGDYGYGIFLLDEKSRDYVLKNIQNEKDPFLRSMMWGALWDSVREGELDPREFVELVVRVLQKPAREQGLNDQAGRNALIDVRASAIEDESTTALLLSRVGTAMNYYIDAENKGRGDTATESRQARVEDMLIERMRNSETLGQRITYYRAFLNVSASENSRRVLKETLTAETQRRGDVKKELRKAFKDAQPVSQIMTKEEAETFRRSEETAPVIPLKTKDKFDIVTRLLILGDPEAPKLLAELEKTETSDDAKRYAYAARAGIATAENKAHYWKDFTENKEISESWIEAAFGPWNSIRHSDLTLPYLQRALQELPNHKRNRKIFFVNGWLGAFIGGQRSEEALATINKFLADNPSLDRDLRLKILENADIIERAVKIRSKFARS